MLIRAIHLAVIWTALVAAPVNAQVESSIRPEARPEIARESALDVEFDTTPLPERIASPVPPVALNGQGGNAGTLTGNDLAAIPPAPLAETGPASMPLPESDAAPAAVPAPRPELRPEAEGEAEADSGDEAAADPDAETLPSPDYAIPTVSAESLTATGLGRSDATCRYGFAPSPVDAGDPPATMVDYSPVRFDIDTVTRLNHDLGAVNLFLPAGNNARPEEYTFNPRAPGAPTMERYVGEHGATCQIPYCFGFYDPDGVAFNNLGPGPDRPAEVFVSALNALALSCPNP